jgi:hypothetical protein
MCKLAIDIQVTVLYLLLMLFIVSSYGQFTSRIYDVLTFREENLSLSLSLSLHSRVAILVAKIFPSHSSPRWSSIAVSMGKLATDTWIWSSSTFTHAVVHLFLLSIHQPNCDDATFKVEKDSIKTKLYLNTESWQASLILRKGRVRSQPSLRHARQQR